MRWGYSADLKIPYGEADIVTKQWLLPGQGRALENISDLPTNSMIVDSESCGCSIYDSAFTNVGDGWRCNGFDILFFLVIFSVLRYWTIATHMNGAQRLEEKQTPSGIIPNYHLLIILNVRAKGQTMQYIILFRIRFSEFCWRSLCFCIIYQTILCVTK